MQHILTDGPEPDRNTHQRNPNTVVVGLTDWAKRHIEGALGGPRYEENVYADPNRHRPIQDFVLPNSRLVIQEMAQVSHTDDRGTWIFLALFNPMANGGKGAYVEESRHPVSYMTTTKDPGPLKSVPGS